MDAQIVLDALQKYGLKSEALFLILNCPFVAGRMAHEMNEVAEIMRLIIQEQGGKVEAYWEAAKGLSEGLNLEVLFALAQDRRGQMVRRRNRRDLMG